MALEVAGKGVIELGRHQGKSESMPKTPKWQVVYDDIVRMIESGELQPGKEIPSTSQLMAKHKVGNNAVRDAVIRLSERGYIETHPGKARYVKERGT